MISLDWIAWLGQVGLRLRFGVTSIVTVSGGFAWDQALQMVLEIFKLVELLDGSKDVLLGGGIAWLLFEVRSQKARADEDRQKNEADHSQLFSAVSELKTKVEILLERSIRPSVDGGAG